MKRTILIDVEPMSTSVALFEDGRLNEFHIEDKAVDRITGNIYKGRVENVLKGLESAFVNIGRGRNGFLNVGEVLDDRTGLSSMAPRSLQGGVGDHIMVQVTKEETGQKGARLTDNISLPGRYVVYCPHIDFVAISNKITDPARREMLTKLLEKHKPKGGGLIARTVCIAAKKTDILAEIHGLQTLYEKIEADYEKASGVGLIHSEGDLVFRALRDMLTADVERIICNDHNTIAGLQSRLEEMGSEYAHKIEYCASSYDVWDIFDIGGEIEKLFERKVELPSGGSLVIDPTEALTAIDVNTGRFTAGDHEETVFLTNLEAAKEIARQLRLRNIGGIIVVDFIDMADEAHRAEVVEALRNEVLLDRIKTRVRDMTELGLVEITRKKVGQPLGRKLMAPCEHCQGRGHRPNALFAARKLRAFVNRALADHNWKNVVVRMHAGLLEYMFSSRYFADICQNAWQDRLVYLVPDPRVKQLEYVITGNNDVALTVPAGARLLY